MVTTLRDTTSSTYKNDWSRVKKHMWLLKSKILRFLFCVNDEMLADIQLDNTIRDDVRECMRSHDYSHPGAVVSTTVKSVYNETGYDLADVNLTISEIKDSFEADESSDVPIPEQQTAFVERELGELGIRDRTDVSHARVRVVPKFVAAMAMVVQSRLGQMEYTTANVLLASKEYHKICTDNNVRVVDQMAHRQVFLNTLFTESVLDEVATTYTTLPTWLREAYGRNIRRTNIVC